MTEAMTVPQVTAEIIFLALWHKGSNLQVFIEQIENPLKLFRFFLQLVCVTDYDLIEHVIYV